MNSDPASPQFRRSDGPLNLLSVWCKITAAILAVLILSKIAGVSIFVEFELDGKPILTALTELKTYYLPLGALLIFFALIGLWQAYLKIK